MLLKTLASWFSWSKSIRNISFFFLFTVVFVSFLVSVPLSPSASTPKKTNEPATTPGKAAPLENNTPQPPKKVVPIQNSQPAGPPVRSVAQLNNKPTSLPAKAGKAPKAAPTVKSTTPVRSTPPEPFRPEPPGSPELPGLPERAESPERPESPTLAASRLAKHITQWNVSEVVDFIKATDCYKFAEDFLRQVTIN